MHGRPGLWLRGGVGARQDGCKVLPQLSARCQAPLPGLRIPLEVWHSTPAQCSEEQLDPGVLVNGRLMYSMMRDALHGLQRR